MGNDIKLIYVYSTCCSMEAAMEAASSDADVLNVITRILCVGASLAKSGVPDGPGGVVVNATMINATMETTMDGALIGPLEVTPLRLRVWSRHDGRRKKEELKKFKKKHCYTLITLSKGQPVRA